MTERVHYSNAPITEATIDLRVVQPQELSIEDLLEIQTLLVDDYPGQEAEFVFAQDVRIGGEEAGHPFVTETLNRQNGFRLTSRDKQRVLYARLDGFALSIRAPYDRWESFRDEARRLWEMYRTIANVEGVTRAAVRYINQLDIAAYADDADRAEFEDFLRVYPAIPRDWPGGDSVNNFFLQLQMWQEDLSCWLIVNEAPQPSSSKAGYVMQLDFDLFREQFEEPWQDDDNVWKFLEQLHVRKNQVFEASITEATRRFIK
jgi:uncharacterized protein (TIGR04255 family)